MSRAIKQLGLYALLAIAASWPLAPRIGSALPLGSQRAATVPLVSAWALGWTSDRIAHGFSGFWDAPIFFPTRGAFAFSEPMPLPGALSAPLIALGATPAFALSALTIVALALNGFFAFRLCLALRLGALCSAFGGALVLLLPYVHHELGVLTLVPLAGVLLALHALLRCARLPSARRGAWLGASVALSFWLCEQHSYYLALALPGALLAIALPRLRARWRAHALAAGSALIVASALIAPIALPQQAMLHAQHFERSRKDSEKGSVGLRTWWRAPRFDPIGLPGTKVASPRSQRALYPGSLPLLLGLAGALFGWRRAPRRRATCALLAVLGVGFLLSVAGRASLGELSPSDLLRAVLPGFAQIRSPWRAAMLAQLALDLLAAQGAFAILARARALPRSPSLARLVTGAAMLLACTELWPAPQALASAPDLRAWAPLNAWLREHTPSGASIALLPFPKSGGVEQYEDTATLMYVALQHGRPIANGYSSYFPARYDFIEERMRKLKPKLDERGLARAKVRVLVVDRARAPELQIGARWIHARSEPALGLEIYTRAP